jgi:predicted Fe-Mo cluster-binding NifX family protein
MEADMKVVVTTVGPDLDSEIEPRFWKAVYFLIADTQTWQCEALPNPGAPTVHAAGTRGAILVEQHKIDASISGDYGPNCYVVLEAAGIRMYLQGSCKTAREAVQAFLDGKLQTIYAPTVAAPH